MTQTLTKPDLYKKVPLPIRQAAEKYYATIHPNELLVERINEVRLDDIGGQEAWFIAYEWPNGSGAVEGWIRVGMPS